MEIFRYRIWLRLVAALFMCVTAPLASAQVFLCKGTDGRQQYQDAPCAASAEVETAWTKKREEDARKQKAEQERRKLAGAPESGGLYEFLMEARKRKPQRLKDCATDKDCSADDLQSTLLTLSQSEVMDALGPPDSVQKFRDELWYYTVIGEYAGAKRRMKLQIEFGAGEHPLTKKSDRLVYKVNVY